jgi:hypothetical protein
LTIEAGTVRWPSRRAGVVVRGDSAVVVDREGDLADVVDRVVSPSFRVASTWASHGA